MGYQRTGTNVCSKKSVSSSCLVGYYRKEVASSCPKGYQRREEANFMWDIGERKLMSPRGSKKCKKVMSHGISEKGRS
jgi:hypothetical protein